MRGIAHQTQMIHTLAALVTLMMSEVGCVRTSGLSDLVFKAQTIPPKGVVVNFCTDPASQPNALLKMIIIQDHSGSNYLNYKMRGDGSGTPEISAGNLNCGTLPDGTVVTSCIGGVPGVFGTDPQGLIRFGDIATSGTLLNYLANSIDNSDSPTKYYSLIGFSDNAVAYPSIPTPHFTPNTTEFYNYVLNSANTIYNAGLPAPQPSSSSSPTPQPSSSDNPTSLRVVTASPAPAYASDGGNTNYLAALNLAYQMISSDIAAAEAMDNPTLSSYVIVFMSDGSPIVGSVLQNINSPPNLGPGYNLLVAPIDSSRALFFAKYATKTVLETVSNLVNLSLAHPVVVAGINLYTIYYYYNGADPRFPYPNIDAQGQALLNQMASAGHGVFYNLTSGSNIDYNLFLPAVKLNKFSLADLFVTNQSVTWWKTGSSPSITSYPNGLPDSVAKAWGITDPSLRDNSGDGVSDAVKYRLYSSTYSSYSSLPSFRDINYFIGGLSSDPYRGACSGIDRVYDPQSNKLLFNSTEHNRWRQECLTRDSVLQCMRDIQDRGLNDCEKVLLSRSVPNATYALPDSNGDLIPDTLEFRNWVPFQVGAPSASNVTPYADGLSQYYKIKYSLPTQFSVDQLASGSPSTYQILRSTQNESQACYAYNVPDLPSSEREGDSIRVDVVLKNEAYPGRYLYRSGIKNYTSGSRVLQFEDWNDETERAVGTWSVWP